MALGTGSLNQVRNILAGTTDYTASAGVKALYIECIGAGQSGAGAASTQQSGDGANGGAAGGYSAFCVSSSLLAAGGMYHCSVGVGGVAPGPGAVAANAGGDTSFTSGSTVICLAPGGGSPTAAVGDLKIAGSEGGNGIDSPAIGGFGAVGPFGGGAMPVMAAPSAPADGRTGVGYGSGGGGGSCLGDVGNATGSFGGAGADGLIRVWEFV